MVRRFRKTLHESCFWTKKRIGKGSFEDWEEYLGYLGFDEYLGGQQLIQAAEEILEKNEVEDLRYCKIF